MIRRFLSATLAAILAAGASPVVFAQQGIVSGRVTSEARKPYTNYTVQLVDVANKQVSGSTPLDTEGVFVFTNVQIDKQYLVQLFSLRENKIVCTEGPYPLMAPDHVSKTDVEIKCGKPAAAWLLTAVAAASATAAITLQSSSQ